MAGLLMFPKAILRQLQQKIRFEATDEGDGEGNEDKGKILCEQG